MITAIIPARIGSKRLKYKNFMDFHGRALAEWSILAALHSHYIDQVIFTTDHETYDYKHPKVIIDQRDTEVCGYDVHTNDIYQYIIKKYNLKGTKIVLEPTSPLRYPELLDEAIDIHLLEDRSVVSVYESNYNPNGLYYIFTGDLIYDKETIPIPTSVETGIDIDHLYQFRIAEFLFKKYGLIERLDDE